jgi:translation initiation factor IF-2
MNYDEMIKGMREEFRCKTETDRRYLSEKVRDYLKKNDLGTFKPTDVFPDKLYRPLFAAMQEAFENREKNRAAMAVNKNAEKEEPKSKAKAAPKKKAEASSEEKAPAKKAPAKKTATKKAEADEPKKAEKPAAKKTSAVKKAEEPEAPAPKKAPVTITAKLRKQQEQEKEEAKRKEAEEKARRESKSKEDSDSSVINAETSADPRVKKVKIVIKKFNFKKPAAVEPQEEPEKPEEIAEAPIEETAPEEPRAEEKIAEPVKEAEPEKAPEPEIEPEEEAKPLEAAPKAEEPESEETETPAEPEIEAPKPARKSKEEETARLVRDAVKPVSTVSVESFVAQQKEDLPRVTETVPLDRLKGWRPPEIGKKKNAKKGETSDKSQRPAASGKSGAAAQPAGPMPDANRKGDSRRGKKDKEKDYKSSASREEMMNRPRISSQASLRQRNADERAGEEGEYRIRRKTKKPQVQAQPTKADIVKGDIKVSVPISVRDFSQEIGVKVGDIIKVFFKMGEMLNINSALDEDHVVLAAAELNVNVQVKSKEENLEEETFSEEGHEEEFTAEEAPRAPVVVFMGHVDHGKTSLIDAIRQSRVAQGESGGITQHIGAYEVDTKQGHITIIDTPGHEAFTTMRARGANATDIAILVVAADDGIMPQTLEAINHARAAKVEIIVAINKMDLPGADPERVIRQLSENNILVEEWGGQVQCVRVSAHTKQGLDDLLERIALQAEVMQLKARSEGPAEGVVLEAELNPGRGTSVTLLVQKGRLKVGDPIVCGTCYAKARAMMNYKGENIKEAGPSQPVQILGFTEVPQPGAKFKVAASEKLAKELTEKRAEEERLKRHAEAARATLESFYQNMKNSDSAKELALIVKGDTRGTTEAVHAALEKLTTDEAKVTVLHSGVGDVTENDVMLASASNGVIIAFKTNVPESSRAVAKSKGVEIRSYDVIYHATEQIQKALMGLLEPTFHEEETGIAEVRQIFKIPGGFVAGSHVISGEIHRSDKVRVMRGKDVVFDGDILTLKHLKDDVKEVRSGYDCGIALNGFDGFAEGDKLHAYKMVQDGLTE